MGSKNFVCICEDVTDEEILESIDRGYVDIESLKRYTSCFMGPCQGKLCMMNFMKLYSTRMNIKLSEIRPPTSRPFIKPVPFWAFLETDE